MALVSEEVNCFKYLNVPTKDHLGVDEGGNLDSVVLLLVKIDQLTVSSQVEESAVE